MTRRVALIGAGFIAAAHARALAFVPGARLAAVIDPNHDAARRLAGPAGAAVFASLAEALAADAFDCAHVLVPPDLHAAIARDLLAAGKPVLLEKPLAATERDAASLVAAAREATTPLGVNQNFVHHPAFVRLRGWVESGALGPPRHADILYNVPLRQMAAGQFGHWMFRAPLNLLLEQAVHPLSQLAALAGPLALMAARPGPGISGAPGQSLFPIWDALLVGTRMDTSLRFAVGQAFPFWQLRVTCDDGVAVADILANRAYRFRRSRWMDAIDAPLSGTRAAARMMADGATNLARYGLSQLRLARAGDPFQASMNASVAAFHAALDAGRAPETDGAFGAALVALCTRMAEAVPASRPAAAEADPLPDPAPPDIALLGGTGFIGTALLRATLAAGRRPVVMARRLAGLPASFHDPRVRLLAGDIRDADAVARAIAGVPVVVNLAHGGGGGTFEEVCAAMLGGAETVARACLASPARPRLIHVGSIAALYLGPQDTPITGVTPPDAQPERRGDYARAKALTDRMLLDLHAREGLAVTILRPGVVVGAGSSPFHSGLGLFNNDQHCIGWNMGRNPLPFVLADDVADAILAAATAPGIEGRCYNLVGDVRLSARAYIAALAHALGRPLRFHPQPPEAHFAVEFAKWAIKRAGGRAVPMPSPRDLRSRGMRARFDCADAARDLGWHPVADPAVFRARAIDVHRAG